MRRKDPDALRKLQSAFEEGGDRRPPLYQWMLTNHDELILLFDGARLNWEHITASFVGMGFQNGAGGDLKPETVRQTWYRVRKRKTDARGRRPNRLSSADVEVHPASRKLQLVNEPVPESGASPFPDTASTALDDLLGEMNKRSGRN